MRRAPGSSGTRRGLGSSARRAILCGVLAVAGCGGGPAPPQDNYYRLLGVAPSTPRAEQPMLAGTLLVNRFGADGVLSQRPVAYADDDAPQTLHQYSYHFWADPPTRMVQDFAVDYLRAAKVARRVVTSLTRVRADFVLSGRIRRLEHIRGARPRVVVAVEVSVVRERDDELVLLQTYRSERDAPQPSVASAVEAMNAVLVELFEALVADLPAR